MTELLLRGLSKVRPEGWIIWGSDVPDALVWPGARKVPHVHSPRALSGQRDITKVPPNDLAIYMHQIRPLRAGRSIQVIYDTIPLHFGEGGYRRWMKMRFNRAVARLSTKVVTFSEFSRGRIATDLKVSDEDIAVLPTPIDHELAARVRRARLDLAPEMVGFFVGRFAPHKNLERLVRGFRETAFAADGGRLMIVGGTPEEVDALTAFVSTAKVPNVEVKGAISQERLEALYATARFVVMPSLEEGIGLPAWEAMSCGLAVCCSRGGSLPEITKGATETFDPYSEVELGAAIDRAAAVGWGRQGASVMLKEAPDVAAFALRFVELADEVRTQ
ncbi:MAG TPA: glycosyltransferase [Actinomycetota bacterium]|nr:glycosyltransferase [Actinomycetota bacterium]